MGRRGAFILCLALAAWTRPSAQSAAGDILISRQLAEATGLTPGATTRLAVDRAGTGARPFRVVGIYEPVPDPMRINASKHEVRLHLPDLLALEAPADEEPDTVDAVNIALADGVDAASFARELVARVPGISAMPVADASSAELFVVLERFHLAIAVVTVLASTVFLLALTIMLVDERRETVGVLRLIGLTSRRILVQVLVEGLVIAGTGAAFGIAVAILSQGAINAFFQWRYDTALVFVRITPDVVWRCLLIAVPLGVAGSAAASWALLRRNVLKLARR